MTWNRERILDIVALIVMTAVSGVAIGAIGLLVVWMLIAVWMNYPWALLIVVAVVGCWIVIAWASDRLTTRDLRGISRRRW